MKNGDFEEGPYISQVYQWVVLVPPTNENILSPLPGWKIMSYSKSVRYIGSSGFAVPKGERAVELMSGLETALVQDQDVDTVGGASYRLEFMVGDAEGTCAASDSPMEVQAYAAQGRTSVRGVRQLRVPHQVRRQRHALRAHHRRRLVRQRVVAAVSSPAAFR
jgi:hypothetical protein